VVANCDRLARLKFSPNLPYAITEHGAIMAANLLRSELAVKLNELESKLQDHDGQIGALIDAIRSLMSEPPARRKPAIGNHTGRKRRRTRK
jgi:hypothetical protein